MSTTVNESKRHLEIDATEFDGQLDGTIKTNTTAITQSTGDNSTKVATTAYADAVLPGWVPSSNPNYLTAVTESDVTAHQAALSITESQINDLQSYLTAVPSGYATESYVQTQITNLVDSAPSALNTLDELAAALGDDVNFSTTVTNSLANKLPLTGGVISSSGTVPLYVRSTGTVSYLQLHNSSTGTNGANDGLTVGLNGSSGYLWLREAANLNIGTNDTSAITIDSSQNSAFAGIVSVPSGKSFRLYNAAGSGWGELYLDETANKIQFNRGIQPSGDNQSDQLLGTASKRWHTVNAGAIVATGEVEATSLDINGAADISGITTLGDQIHFTAGGSLIRKSNSGWSNATTHDLLYQGWLNNPGDYVYLKAPGNSTTDHGIALIADNVIALGRSDVESGHIDTDSATAPLSENWFVLNNSSATFAGSVTTGGDIDLPSGSMIDWSNGDARIQEGLVNNYSLSFQTYDGSAVTTALRLDGDNTAIFEGSVGIGTAPVSGVELHVNGEIRVDNTNGVATRMIRSNYFSASSDIEVRSGASGDIILGDGTARLTLASDDTATFAGTITTDRLSLFTSNTDRATIQAGSSGTTGHLYLNSYQGSDLHQLTWSGANNGFYPQGASGTFSLGLNGNRWSNVYTTALTASGEVEGGSLDINGDADISGETSFKPTHYGYTDDPNSSDRTIFSTHDTNGSTSNRPVNWSSIYTLGGSTRNTLQISTNEDYSETGMWIRQRNANSSSPQGTGYQNWTEVWTTNHAPLTKITNWDAGYTYSGVGHLPLAAGSGSPLTGDLYLTLSGSTQRALSSTGTNSMQIGDAGTQELKFKNAAGNSLTINSSGNATFAGSITSSGSATFASDTDAQLISGRAKIGSYVGDYVYFSHIDYGTSSNYALKQSPTGNTEVNAPTNGTVALSINNSPKLSVTGDNSTFHNDIVIDNHNGSNPTDAGSLYFNESGTTWGTDMYGFRINLEGSSNLLNIQSHDTSTERTILSMARDNMAVTFGGSLTIPNYIYHAGDANSYFGFEYNDAFRVVAGGGEKLHITTSRARFNSHIYVGLDSAYDIGQTGTRFRNIYADTLYGDGSNITNVSATDSTKLPLAGGTMSGAINILTDTSSEGAMLKIEQDGTGDAVIDYVLTDTNLWRVGIDNSSSDAFKWGIGSFGSYERMSLSTAGTLTVVGGVTGTTLTGTSLDINGDADISGTLNVGQVDADGNIAVVKGSATIRVEESGGADVRMVAGGSTGYIGTYSNDTLQIQQNSAPAITIDTSRNSTFAGSITLPSSNTLTGSSGKVGFSGRVSGSTPTGTTDFTTKAYVDLQIANLVASAPSTLDTLNELADALGDDANFSTTVTNSIATKLPLAGGTMSGDIVMGNNDITGVKFIQANGNVDIRTGSGEYAIHANANGQTALYNNGLKKFETTSTGATINSSTATFLIEGDGVTSSNLKFRSNSVDRWNVNVPSGQTNLAFTTGSTNVLSLDTSNNATFGGNIIASSNTAVIQTPRISMEADGTLDWGASRDYGTLTFDTGKIMIRALSGKAMELQTNGATTALTLDTSQNATFAGDINLGANHIGRDGDNYVGFETDNLIKFRVNGATQVKLSDGVLSPQTDSDVDLGTNSVKFKNAYLDSIQTPLITTATDTSLKLRPDGTGHLYLGDAGEGFNIYHYNSGEDGTYATYNFNGGWYTLQTNQTSGIKINDPLDVQGNITVSGNIILGGTGRIQGIDTVSASTDAASKSYVDTTVSDNSRDIEIDSSGNGSVDSTLAASESLRFKKGDNISIEESGGVITINSDNTTYSVGDNGLTQKNFTTTLKNKLDGVATNATANSSDATLKARGNHTGTQAANTISDFDTEVSNNTTVTSKANIASPTFTGVVTSPAVKVGDVQLTTSIASTHNYNGFTINGDDFGNADGTDVYQGDLVCLKSTGRWETSDANDSSISVGMLAIQTGEDMSSLLTHGTYHLSYDPGGNQGDPLYISESTGRITATKPTTSGAIVRVVGYLLSSADEKIYFNPDGTWIEV